VTCEFFVKQLAIFRSDHQNQLPYVWTVRKKLCRIHPHRFASQWGKYLLLEWIAIPATLAGCCQDDRKLAHIYLIDSGKALQPA
jgi:hypothetical protein